MEALIIIAGSLLVGLIMLLASEKQIASNRKSRNSDLKEEALPFPRDRRFSRDEYEDIFYPKNRSTRLRRAADAGFRDIYDDYPLIEKETSKSKSGSEKKGNVVSAYINFMAVIIVLYLLFQYMSSL